MRRPFQSPRSSARATSGPSCAFEEGRALTRVVEIGHRNSSIAEVEAGLAVGARVILHPSDRVGDGTSVKERGKAVARVARGELLIPTLILQFGAEIKLAGSLSLAVSRSTPERVENEGVSGR